MAELELNDRTCVVTGGASGVGLGIVQALTQQGARVVVVDVDPKVHQVAADLRVAGFDVYSELADLCQPNQIEELVARIYRDFGDVHGLVNNAGLTIRADFLSASLSDFQRQVDLNLRATFLCSQLVARGMVARSVRGGIVNIGSNHAGASVPGFEAYAATKGGIVSMTRSMAWSLGVHGIRVNCVSPGLTRTPAIDKAIADDLELDFLYPALHATQRFNEPQDVGELVAFVLSSRSRAITGADLIADNGMSARLFNRPYK